MRFKGLDLNLLVTLDRLLAERNVSRAADKLCLSQSATSGALARLRDYFGDELLVQAGRGMALTPRAEELQAAIRHALMQIDATIITRQDLDLREVKRDVKVIASDYVCIAFLARATRLIQREAPGLGFTFLLPNTGSTGQLTRGNADLVVMPERFLTGEHPSQHLFTDHHVALVAKDNQIVGDHLDRELFMSLPQVTVRLPDGPPNYETAIADLYGNRRKLDVVMSNFSSVPFMLPGTNRVAIVHERLGRIFCESMPLRMLPAPMELPPLRVSVQWHELGESDKLIAFVKNRLLQIAAEEG